MRFTPVSEASVPTTEPFDVHDLSSQIIDAFTAVNVRVQLMRKHVTHGENSPKWLDAELATLEIDIEHLRALLDQLPRRP